MDKIIEKYETVDLSGSDIHRMCKGKVRIIVYEDMEKYTKVDDIFDQWNATIILYETRKNFGHWTLLLKHSDTVLEFFDSYGLKVDEELKFDHNYNSRIHNGQVVPHLTYLLGLSNYELIQNRKKLQLLLKDVNTCGRWVVARTILRDIHLLQFQKLMTENKNHNPDFWVTSYTMLL